MKPEELWNRGNNLVATAILALSGLSFLPEYFLEDEWQHKIDEALLFWIGVGALVWYLWGKHKFQRSLIPVLLVWGGLAAKILGVILEFKDKADLGDDFGALILFGLASVLVTFLYLSAKKVFVK